MRVSLHEVGKGRDGRVLPPVTLSYRSGAATLACEETEQRPTVLGLIASGRMRPDRGRVTVDGRSSRRELRRRVALVDAPDVSDPHPDVTVAGVAAEELMFAGRMADPLSARRWLAEQGLARFASTPIGMMPAIERLRMLCELAALRPGVEGIVLVSPDRHGGEPTAWWQLAQRLAARGVAVLVIAGDASRSVIETRPQTPQIRPSRAGRRIHQPRRTKA